MSSARLRQIALGMLLSLAAAAGLTLVEAVALRIEFISTGTQPDSFFWVVERIGPVWLIFVALLWVVRYLVRRFPFERAHIGRAIAVHTIAALLFPIVHLGALGLARVLNGEWVSPRFLLEVIAYYYVRGVGLYLFSITAFFAAHRSREVRERRIAQAELQAALAEARLQTLRGQLSPHFLFNVLNTVGMLVRAERSEEALSLLSEFSDLLRVFLRQPQSDLVSLDQEVRFAEQYLGLQRARFGDRMRVSFDVETSSRDREVPSFVLYPLVENAVKHGIGKTSGGGSITVRAHDAGGRLVLEVEDDGPGVAAPSVADGAGLGLANLRARLASLYGDGASLSLVRGERVGSVARVVLPA
jgi:two-component system, LytTR family, sensor kinase